jgi:hypothetical protein
MPMLTLELRKASRTWLISALVLGSCSACSRDLSRSKAAELISSQQHLPRTQTITLSGKYLRRSWSRPVVGFGTVTLCVHEGAKYGDVEDRLVYYQSKGLISIGFVRDNGSCPAIYATVSLTNEGRKYIAAADSVESHKVKGFDLVFGDVTGIQTNEQFKAAQVDYTLKLTNITPFGSNAGAEPIPRVATFAQFDDGWRIQPAAVETVSPRFQDAAVTPTMQEARRAIAAAEAAEEDAQRNAQAEAERQQAEAQRLAEERAREELRKALPNASKTLVGTWRNQRGIIEIRADGSYQATYEDVNASETGTWRLTADIFTTLATTVVIRGRPERPSGKPRGSRIVRLGPNSYEMQGIPSGVVYKASRIE